MRSILLSTAYLPPIRYFSYLVADQPVMIEKWEHYPKQTYRNRCHIHSANGLLALSIPVTRGRLDHTPVKDVRISQEEDWQKIHWRSIESAYRSSPFFEFYEDSLIDFYKKKYTFLLDYNNELLSVLLELLHLDKEITFTKEFIKSYNENIHDLRYAIHPKENRAKVGTQLSFQPYHQVFDKKNGFIPDLSIIDLLFNTGPESINYLRNNITTP